MKNKALALSLLAVLTTAPFAHALELKVINQYDSAETAEIWEKTKADQVPEALMGSENISSPKASYSKVFPKSFLQDDMFAVCYQDCNKKEALKIKKGEISKKDDWNVVEQSNVYFWLNRYFSFLNGELLFQPQKFLKVMTNRVVKDEGKKLTNNAFFNPADISLSFLPANKNLLFKVLSGKINRSGFDPSVIAHEASHYLFHHLFPNPVNDEIGGLNEGFADYIANIFLGNPKVGLIMLRGKALRDSSSPMDKKSLIKTYEPRMEVHDLGERIAYALWATRELANDKNEFDRLTIDAVQDLGQNPYSTIHDFKNKMLERFSSVLDSRNEMIAKANWNMVFPGSAKNIANLDFLQESIDAKKYVGFKVLQVMSKDMAESMGVPAETKFGFTLLKIANVGLNQKAYLIASENEKTTTPYWIVIDTERSNILGIYSINHQLVTDEKELETAKQLASQITGSGSIAVEFSEKIKAFAELYEGKGQFSSAYKMKSKTTQDSTIVFNGEVTPSQKIEMNLKRRLLIGLIFGIPEIETITLHTIARDVTGVQVNGQDIMGYSLKLKSGTTMEVILDKYSK